MNKEIYPDPNEEVERWKDDFYKEIRDLSDIEVGLYIDKKAKTILQKYGLRITYYRPELRKARTAV